jgi:hypothetical protein
MGRRRRQRRRPFHQQISIPVESTSIAGLLLLGLVLGLAGGLTYAWLVAPVEYTDASPARLSDRYQAEYIFLVSQSYAADGDWSRAEQRLSALDDPEIGRRVEALLESYLRDQRPADEIRNMAILAQGIGAQGALVALFAPTPLPGSNGVSTPTATPILPPTATGTATPRSTQTPFPTIVATPIPSPSATTQLRYRLLAQQRICFPDDSSPAIEVITQDALLNPLPGAEVIVKWDRGEDHFFTGFKPERGPGYGDFTMSPDISYTVALADGSPEVSGLRVVQCENGQQGGWQLTFQNLIVRLRATPEA